MRNGWATMLAVMLCRMSAGCAYSVPDEAPVERMSRTEQALDFGYYHFFVWSWDLYGIGLNGTGLNGHELDGHGITHIATEGATTADGTPLTPITLDGSTLTAALAQGHKLNARNWVGVKLSAALDDGRQLSVRIDAVEPGHGREERDITRYVVSYETSSGFVPYCGTDANGEPRRALALSGRWEYRQGVANGGAHVDTPAAFTFACEGFALAKCVEMGYAPWRTGRICSAPGQCTTATLAPLHQACTRALRADYCGDGTSYTQDGMTINVYDAVGIRADSSSWAPEAEWDERGARCLARERLADAPVPSCASDLLTEDCGSADHFSPEATLLITEVP